MKTKNKFMAFVLNNRNRNNKDLISEQTDNVELSVMAFILTGQSIPAENVPIKAILADMEAIGFTKLEANIALRALKVKGFIDLFTSYNEHNNKTYPACSITEQGEAWVIKNKHLLINRDINKAGQARESNRENTFPKKTFKLQQA